ncbi:MAG: hypothetical protein QM621_06400 [Aeromicrobium sp.]|uniref:hypothetical protein n=1 Tax=Aeromicrobium sp. TaxID=1871063 RepID=UPI0039E2CD67
MTHDDGSRQREQPLSIIVAWAIREFLDGQGDDPVTAALDALADELNAPQPTAAARSLIDSGAWEW